MGDVGPVVDLDRAEAIRRRARIYAGVVAALWVPFAIVADPQNHGTIWGGLPFRIPTLAAVLLMAVTIRKIRSRRWVETVVVATFGFVAIVWGRVVIVCAPATVIPNMVSIVASFAILPLGLLLSSQGAASLAMIANTSMLVGGLLREPRPDDTYFFVVSTSFAFVPIVLIAAASRDRWQRNELEARRQLREANEQLRREQEARSRLFVNLSHDFRTPLAVVRASVDDLRRRGTELATLDRIEANIGSLLELIEQLLELARLDAARAPVSARTCDLAATAREIAAQLRPTGGEVQIEVEQAGPAVHGTVDPAHLRRILQNLVANALRALADRSGTVTLRVSVGEEGVPVVEVADDGPGVPPELRDRIFDRFASFRPEGGTVSGIGLALARELADLNGGSLRLLPDAPRTTFRLTLRPAGDDRAAAVFDPPRGAPAVQFVADDGRSPEPNGESAEGRALKPSLLIVEDNEDLRTCLVGLLGPRFDVATVASLAGAGRALYERVPDAIVSDVLLPDGDGYELLAAVRTMRRLDPVPVILLTALGETAERVRGLAAGADDYVTKPFSGDELAARIESAIDRSRQRRAAIDRQREDLLMELHDGVCGSLARAVLALDGLAAREELQNDVALASATAAIREGLAEARGLLTALGNAAEPWEGFVAQLRWESVTAAERAGVALDVSVEGRPAPLVLPAVAHAVRRMAAEAVTNAVRHGQPRRVNVTLAGRSDALVLRVEDDGRGSGETIRAGHGLAGIERRARRLGGGATFSQRPSGGFALEAWVAWDEAASAPSERRPQLASPLSG